ncbi:MAG: glycosyltransferase family 2 protein [Anaerolineae bacterium]
MENNTPPTVSVIIPVHNGRHTFPHCLASVAEAIHAPHEVIVVGDGVGHEYDDLLAHYGFRYLKLDTCQGAARARNVGAQVAAGDVLFFLDSDVTVPGDVLQQVLAVFQDEPDVDALIGSYDDAPSETNFLSQYKNLFHHYVHQNSSEEASTFWGACGAIRRKVFWQLDGFDTDYQRATIEDIELGYRLRDAGSHIKMVKSLQVKHLKRWETASFLRTEVFDRALPWVQLIWQNRKLINDLNLEMTSRLSTIFVFGLLLSLVVTLFSWHVTILPLILFAAGLLWLNRGLYRFFWRRHNFWFAVQTIPWHWFYYLYSGLAFALGTIHYVSQNSLPSQYPSQSVALDQ